MKHGFRRIALIGLGLIGSSLAHAVRRQQAGAAVIGWDACESTRQRATELGFCDQIASSAAEAASGADLVLLCVPVGAMAEVGAEIGAHLGEGCVVSDTGSVKAAVIRALRPHVPAGAHFIPAHPVAGTEESGPDAGFAGLFERRWCILTPPPDTAPEALARLRAFWEECGARVTFMDAEHHDMVLAITSHVPHLIAFGIVDTAAGLETVRRSEVIKFSAGGFRDFTRIASSDAVMWRDVFLHNSEAVVAMLDQFSADVAGLRAAIVRGDQAHLEQAIRHAQDIRRRILEAGEDSAVVDFGRHQARSGEGGKP